MRGQRPPLPFAACLAAFPLLFARCASRAPALARGPTPGALVEAKLVVYEKFLKSLMNYRDTESVIFLEGTPAEQKIFVREFNRKNFPVKDVALRVPALYRSDADAATGERAMYLNAILLESSPARLVFWVQGTGFFGRTTVTLERVDGRWRITEQKTVPYKYMG